MNASRDDAAEDLVRPLLDELSMRLPGGLSPRSMATGFVFGSSTIGQDG